MPWNEVSVMDQRCEFVRLALQEGANRRELCRRFGISPDVGYKWRLGDGRPAIGSWPISPVVRSGCPSAALLPWRRRS